MSNKYKCSIEDLFELFSDSLSPSDVMTSKLMAQISSAITRERLKLKLNQSEFAEIINASQSLVSRWEHGDYNFSIKKLSEIATKLDLDVNILITNKNSISSNSFASFSQTRIVHYCKKTVPKISGVYSTNNYKEEVNKYASIC